MSCRSKKQIFWDNIKAHREMVALRSLEFHSSQFVWFEPSEALMSDSAPSNRIATQNESETLEGIAERVGLDCDAYQNWDLLLSAIHRKLDAMKFELDAYKYLTEAETIEDKEIF